MHFYNFRLPFWSSFILHMWRSLLHLVESVLKTLLLYTSHIKYTGGSKQILCNFWKTCVTSNLLNHIERISNIIKMIINMLPFEKLPASERLGISSFFKIYRSLARKWMCLLIHLKLRSCSLYVSHLQVFGGFVCFSLCCLKYINLAFFLSQADITAWMFYPVELLF